jgi:selenocysteine lyase/cysteine desulfurase
MLHSRRLFFKQLPVIGTAGSWAAFAAGLQSAGTAADQQDSYWRLVKQQFPLEDGLIYLNAANVCPASRPVLDRYQALERDFHANPSFQNRDKYKTTQERLRGKLARLLNASADEIAITRNTSEGSNVVVKGIDLKPGDEILITDHNHPSNNEAWRVRARRERLQVKSLPVPVPAKSRGDLLAAFEKAITPKTRVVAITHVTSTTGILYPAAEIATLAHKHGAWLHLDGAQTFGVFDVDLKALGCDSYSGSAHKWMMGPLEAGVLHVTAERIAELWPSIVTAGWTNELKGARKFDVVGQRDDPRVAAFEAAVDFISLIGIQKVEARTRMLASHLKRRLLSVPGVRLKTNVEPELSGGVVRFVPGDRPLPEIYDRLWTKHRIALLMTPAGDSSGLRFSPHVYNSIEELDRAAEAVREVMA